MVWSQLDLEVWEDQGSSLSLLVFCLAQSRCLVSTPRTQRHHNSSLFLREAGSSIPEVGSFSSKALLAFWVIHHRLDWGCLECW